MFFTWRELWSRPQPPAKDAVGVDSKGAVITCGLLEPYRIRGPGCTDLVLLAGAASWCRWNGVFVFAPYVRKHRMIARYRDDGDMEQLDMPDLTEEIKWLVALKDGGLIVRCRSEYAVVRNGNDGRMETAYVGEWPTFLCPLVSWWNGVLMRCLSDHWFWHATTGKTTVFREPCTDAATGETERCPDVQDVDAYISDRKHCCIVTNGGTRVIEWGVRGEGAHVFPLQRKGFSPTKFLGQVGTCLGRAVCRFGDSETCLYRPSARPAHAFVYVGGGRFEKAGDGSGVRMWHDDRAYHLDDSGTLRCYEARETPDSLLDICVRRAASALDPSSFRYLPVELRERIERK